MAQGGQWVGCICIHLHAAGRAHPPDMASACPLPHHHLLDLVSFLRKVLFSLVNYDRMVSVITFRAQNFEIKDISITQSNPYFFLMHFKTGGWSSFSWEKLMISQESFCRQIRRICLNWYDSSCVAATAWLVAYLPSRAAATPTPALFHTHSPMIICWIWFLSSFCLVTCKLQDGCPTIALWSFFPVCFLLGLFFSPFPKRTYNYMQRPPRFCL